LKACFGHSLLRSLNHLRSEIYPDNSAWFPDFVSSENDIYPTTATEINNYIAQLKIREASGIATTSGEIESILWN
jgi:hypothetical protein